MKLPKLHKLNNRGVAHYILPLAALALLVVGGAYTVVSKANNANLTAAATKTAKPKGILVVYSEQGRFNSAKIRLAPGTTTPAATSCGGALNSANEFTLSKSLPATKAGVSKPIKLKCAPTGASSDFYVYFGKDKKYTSTYTPVDIDDGFCTLVHADTSKTRKTPIDAQGNCTAIQSEADLPTKVDLAVRVLPTLTASKKNINGYVELSAGESLTRPECTGSVYVTYQRLSGSPVTFGDDRANGQGISLALKYVKAAGKNNGNGYCATKLSTNYTDSNGRSFKKFMLPGYSYTVSASFSGNAYFNPVSLVKSAPLALPAAAGGVTVSPPIQ